VGVGNFICGSIDYPTDSYDPKENRKCKELESLFINGWEKLLMVTYVDSLLGLA